MKRYLSSGNLSRFTRDFRFLFASIKASHGELDLRLRNDYFNLYYRGNSMLKVSFGKPDYKIAIHEKFACDVFGHSPDPRITGVVRSAGHTGKYLVFHCPQAHLHPFLQRDHLRRLESRIKRVNHGEEIAFEHALITDNMNREDLFIIDRQVREPGSRLQMDLLALRQVHGSHYSFEIIEVKMGNNPELAGSVGAQLDTYMSQIRRNIHLWTSSYEMRILIDSTSDSNLNRPPSLRSAVHPV